MVKAGKRYANKTAHEVFTFSTCQINWLAFLTFIIMWLLDSHFKGKDEAVQVAGLTLLTEQERTSPLIQRVNIFLTSEAINQLQKTYLQSNSRGYVFSV